MGQARFGILGAFEVRVAEVPVQLSAAQLRRLACSLVLVPGRPVRHDALVAQMWPGDDFEAAPRDPLATLRVYASRLRKLLPEGVGPHVDDNGYRLEIGRGDVDADQLETAVAATSGILLQDPERAGEMLRQALALWRGPALSEFRDEPWAQGTAARLDELREVARERFFDCQLALAGHDQLCAELEAAVEQDPLRERFWAQLMTALYRSGRQAEALRAYQRLRETLISELGIEPSRELVDLEAALLRQDASLDLPRRRGTAAAASLRRADPLVTGAVPIVRLAAPHQPGNLPHALTSFIGREKETLEVRGLVLASRLVTLAGAGGGGKTRLGIEVAGGLRAGFPDGVFVVELAVLRDPAQVASVVAATLGIKPRSGAADEEALLGALESQHLLLLLDNCEQVVSACARLAQDLLSACSGLRILATSRQPLGVEGEVVYRIPPLGLPPSGLVDPETLGRCDAVRLFVERARAQRQSFELDESNSAAVASMCRRLDGMPLALELAAARVGTLSVAEIDARLDQRFRLLVGGSKMRLERQQTLRALIDWSYELINESERELLRRLAVFPASFELGAASAVLEASGADAWSVLDHIASLVDKSLVLADVGAATTRYRMLETIRQYALDRLLEEDGEAVLGELRRAHARAYLELAETAEPELATRRQVAWLDRLEAEQDNLRAALSHFVTTPGETEQAMRMATALARYFSWRGNESELFAAMTELDGRPELEQREPVALRFLLARLKVLAQAAPDAARTRLGSLVEVARALGQGGLTAEVLNRLSWIAWSTGDYPASRRYHASAVELAREAGEYLPLSLSLIGGGASREERLEALELANAAGDAIGRYTALSNLGAIANDEGDVSVARQYFEQALPLIEAIRPGDPDPALLVNLGNALVLDGAPATAATHYARALEAARRHLDERQTGYGILGRAMCATAAGEPLRAARLHGAAAAQFARGGFALEEAEGRMAAADEARLRHALGEQAFEEARDEGLALDRAASVELALAGDD